MRIEYCRNKKNGTVYVYRAESYYDPTKKRCGARRKLIGKLDPETNEVIPTGKRGRPRKVQEQPSKISEVTVNSGGRTEEAGAVLELTKLHDEMTKLNEKVIKMDKFISVILSAVDAYRNS